jgi:hypothetical protein
MTGQSVALSLKEFQDPSLRMNIGSPELLELDIRTGFYPGFGFPGTAVGCCRKKQQDKYGSNDGFHVYKVP